MFDQHKNGNHEITLHKISCPRCEVFPDSTGVLKWERTKGITYSFTFTGIYSLVGSPYYKVHDQENPGVGRLSQIDLASPRWIAETDDGTEVHLYGVNETLTSSRSESNVLCCFEGMASFAVIDIPVSRMLAFDNSTQENYRLFFTGSAGRKFNDSEMVVFKDFDGNIHESSRCSTTLLDSPRIVLVGANAFVECKPSGWLAFEEAPTDSDCEIPASDKRNFVSFLHGENVPFHWADRRISAKTIRRTYFGWIKSREKYQTEIDYQPLPFMDGIEAFEYGNEVLSHLSDLFQNFIEKSKLIDFGVALNPLWTASQSVLEDKLALASISLERTASIWKTCGTEVLTDPPASDASMWKNRPLLRPLRQGLRDFLNEFVESEACGALSDQEKTELHEVVAARINNITGMPNSAQLRRPFDDLGLSLSAKESEAIQQRNNALHGQQENNRSDLEFRDASIEYFDIIRMLITKFVLKLCDYRGPYIDYASRPIKGNFEVKRLD